MSLFNTFSILCLSFLLSSPLDVQRGWILNYLFLICPQTVLQRGAQNIGDQNSDNARQLVSVQRKIGRQAFRIMKTRPIRAAQNFGNLAKLQFIHRLLLRDIVLVKWSEVVDPNRQVVAHLQPMLITEDRRRKLVPGDENFRRQTEALANKDGGRARGSCSRTSLASVHSGTTKGTALPLSTLS